MALQLFGALPRLRLERDVVCFGAALAASEWPEALATMEAMRMRELRPNEVCYSAWLKGVGEPKASKTRAF